MGEVMAYEFTAPNMLGLLGRTPYDEERRRMAQLMATEQPPVQTQTGAKQQEPLDGKGMINAAVAPAVMPQAPNTYGRDLAQEIITAKENYNAATKPEERTAANAQADFVRNVANAAGIDLSGYGAGVSLQDAYRNFASSEARDIMEALQGAYSMNSNQYYERKFDEALMRGLPRGRAQRLASAQAREYQANRVAYLDGVYNSYGHDGLVTTKVGNQILAALGMENPTLANFYSNVYPNAQDAYRRQNELEDKALDQTNYLARLLAGGEVTRANQDNATRNEMNMADYNAILESEREAAQDARNWANAYRAQDMANLQAEIERNRKITEANNFANQFGLTGKARDYFIAKHIGLPTPDEQDLNKELLKAADNYVQRLEKQRESIYRGLGSEHMSDEDKAALREQLPALENSIKETNQRFGTMFGLRGDTDTPEYSGDESKDLQTVRTILSLIAENSVGGQLSEGSAFDAIRDWANQSEEGKKLSDDDVRAIIGKALSG